eukprot:TRINITY_DN5686_c0_g1_i1.p1 TRINITY_DN5686_c0_g1~~TRINITY_DN5686_c0_g1_i1.p1  ORF type:complete len:465 (+),score=190.44 TRINITY_DN5686_c0_g1_i1:1431-2825(+)
MQCMQAALSIQLEEVLKQYPNKKVVMITFNDEVTIIGDATQVPQVIAGDKLNDYNLLLNIGKEFKLEHIKPIKSCHTELSKTLFELSESGATALGPALAIACGLASQTLRAEVVLCTDGLSNIGVGSLDDDKSIKQIYSSDPQKKCGNCKYQMDPDFESCPKCNTPVEKNSEDAKTVAEVFYETIGHTAKTNGTVVSVIGIQGSDCAMSALGRCAELSNGEVNIVNPFELQRKMRKILDNPVIATDVQMKAILHPTFVFQHEAGITNQGSLAVRDIGNATAETDVTFEFKMREKSKLPDHMLKLYSVPFQLQLRYTRLDGTKCLRIITVPKKATQDRKIAEKSLNVSVAGIDSIQQASRLALEGQCEPANKYLLSTKKFLEQCAVSPLQQEELSIWKNDFFQPLTEVLRKNNETKKGKFSDESAKVLYGMKAVNLVGFLSGEKKRIIVTKRKNHTNVQKLNIAK